MASNGSIHKINVGDYVTFPYRHNPSLQVTGYIVRVLEHTSIVDISEMESFFNLELMDAKLFDMSNINPFHSNPVKRWHSEYVHV